MSARAHASSAIATCIVLMLGCSDAETREPGSSTSQAGQPPATPPGVSTGAGPSGGESTAGGGGMGSVGTGGVVMAGNPSGGSTIGGNSQPGGNDGGAAGGGGAAPGLRWIIDNTTRIADLPVTVLGSPKVVTTPFGEALCFDGDDGVLIPKNPIEGLAAFTLEVLFRPDAVLTSETALNQPRFVHIETTAGDRATIEARVTPTDFHLDTFLLSGNSSKTLIDSEKKHDVGNWYWGALTYGAGTMRHFVNAVEDASGSFNGAPLAAGQTSIGVRQNQVYWFKGCVRELRVTAESLTASVLQRTPP